MASEQVHSWPEIRTPHTFLSLVTPQIPKTPKNKKFQPWFVFLCSNMTSTSEINLQEKFEALMKNYQAVSSSKVGLEKQNEYLRKQLGNDMNLLQKAVEIPIASVHDEDEASNVNSSSNEEEPLRRVRGARRTSQNSNDFKVEIPEFHGKLDPNEFLE